MDTMTRAPRDTERGPRPSLGPVAARLVLGLVILVLVGTMAFLLHPGGTKYVDRAIDGPPATHPVPPPAATPTPPTLAAPALLTTGAVDTIDWAAAVRSLVAYRYWVLTFHPDPALLANVLDPAYRVVDVNTGQVTSYATMVSDVTSLARGDLRWDPPVEPTAVSIVTLQGHDAVSASVFVRFPAMKGGRIIGRDGQVTSYPDTVDAAVVWRMVLNPDGRWKLAGVKAP